MGKNLDRMKKTIDENRKANGEPPRPKPMPVVPPPKPAEPAKPSEEADAVFATLRNAAEECQYDTKMGTGTFSAPFSTLPGITSFLRHAAAKLVRHFPGLTRRPNIPEHVRLDNRMKTKGRLPAGAWFDCRWDGSAWAVHLFIPEADGDTGTIVEHEEFVAKDKALFKTLVKADDLYRASLTGKPKDSA